MNTATLSPPPIPATCTAFDGHRRIASGELPDVAIAVRRAHDARAAGPVLIYDDTTGHVVEADVRGTDAEIRARLTPADSAGEPHTPAQSAEETPPPRGRGRPKLGVVSREVTLLPRHWEWLTQQSGGASVALRKLVDQARHADMGATQQRQRQEATYRFMASIGGNLPGFEEATRALFAHDPARFMQHTAAWPRDVREYATHMAFGARTDCAP